MKSVILLLVAALYSDVCFGFEARLKLLKGEVLVNDKKAVLNQLVQEGDHIIAKGEKSFFKITYSTGTKYLIRNGELLIEELEEDTSRISLIKGHSFFNVDKKDREHFKIKTNHVSMGVRGTTFYVYEDEVESYLCVCSGIVRISKDDQFLDVFKNQDIHAYPDKSLSKTKATEQMIEFANDVINKL